MEAKNNISFKDTIIRSKIMDDGRLLLVDAMGVVKFLGIKTLKTISGFKCGIEYKSFNRQVFDFSGDGLYFTLISSTQKESLLYDASSKKILLNIDRHKGEVNCVAIDPKSKYMISCGDDGKSYAVDMKKNKIAFALLFHGDSINDVAFSENSQWIATASYDKKIHLFNIATMTKNHKSLGHGEAVLKVHFLCKKRLLSIDKANNAVIWDYQRQKIIQRLEGVHDDVSQIASSKDGRFLFLGTLLGYIIVYELESYKLLSKSYIKQSSSITALTYDEKTSQLIVATKDSNLFFYDIFESEEYMVELLKVKKYKEIESLVEINSLLAYTKVYQIYLAIWEKTLQKAKLALQRNDKKIALALFKNFQDVPARNSIIKSILIEYQEFDKFVKFAQESKFQLAYALALKHPQYQESQIYKILELNWEKAFEDAQKYAISPRGADLTRDILAPYRGVSQKTKLIQDLFLKSEIYQRFYKAIGDKNFKVVFNLIRINPFLTQLQEYTSLLDYADSLYIESHKLIEKNKINAAIENLEILLDFTDYAQEAKELLETLM